MHKLFLAILLVVNLMMLHIPQAQAQASRLCFDAPGITNCIEGRFREYWEQNGGLAVFGYPITSPQRMQTASGTFLTQYFERNRFELHPEKAQPYDVLLGRLGDDELQRQGLQWQDFMDSQQSDDCLWFAATQQTLCDSGAPFKTYWESHGLLDPALNNYQRSLALFGMPLSSTQPETNANGDTVITQWFERARFEYHPMNPPGFQVLLGLLGNESRTDVPAEARRLPNGSVWVHTMDSVRAVTPQLPTVTLSKGQGLSNVVAAPDGSLIVYVQHTALGREGAKLWALNPQTGVRRVLYDVAGTTAGAAFSPDGKRLVVSVVVGLDRWQLVEIEVQSGNSRVITQGADNAFLSPIAWTAAGLMVDRRRWGTDAPPEDVMLIDPANGTIRTVYRGGHWSVAISSDGKRVAVTTGTVGMGQEPEMSLEIILTDTGRKMTVVSKAKRVLQATNWSPDGTRLAYQSYDRNQNTTLHVVNAEGSNVQALIFPDNGPAGRLMQVRWRDDATLVLLTARAKQTEVYDLALAEFTRAGLKPVGTFRGGLEAPAAILYIP